MARDLQAAHQEERSSFLRSVRTALNVTWTRPSRQAWPTTPTGTRKIQALSERRDSRRSARRRPTHCHGASARSAHLRSSAVRLTILLDQISQ